MKVHRNGAMRHRKPRRRPERVEVVRVDHRVMKTALQIAKGDASRLRIISATEVEVRNQ
jgi:hypothetical protein